MPFDPNKKYHILRSRDRAQLAREDTTGILIAKYLSIMEQDDRGLDQVIDEILSDRERAYGTLKGLISLVLQYAEATNAGYQGLIVELVGRLDNNPLQALET